MALKVASTGPLPVVFAVLRRAVDHELQFGRLRPLGAGDHLQRDEFDPLVAALDLVVDQRDDVLVEDVLLAVGEILEAAERVVDGVVAELEAQLLELHLEGVPAGMLAHDQRRLAEADRFGGHDLVGAGVLEHAVLMDAALMREGVGADDRLVGLHDEAGDGRDQARGARDVLGS